MALSDSRSVNRCGHGHLACKFPINVTVPAKGMPTWKGVFTDEQFEQIYAFLFSVQSKE